MSAGSHITVARFGAERPGDGPSANMRQHNLRRALQLVVDASGDVTRAEIARDTGLTSATASSLVAELIDAGFVREAGLAPSTGGKPAMRLTIDPARHLIVAIVVHPREASIGVLSIAGKLIARESVVYGSAEPIDAIAELVRRTRARFDGKILSVGVQVPGTTDGRVVHESVQLSWTRLALADAIEQILDVPVYVVNDVDAGATAEGVLRPTDLRLFVHLGAGIGAAVTSMGRVLPGVAGRAGEIGHVRVLYDGQRERCRCGLTGCLESAASLSAMLGPAFHDDLPSADVRRLAMAHAGSGSVRTGATALARALRMLSALVDPGEIVLGGSVPALGEEFLASVRDELEMYAAQGTAPIRVRYATEPSSPFLGAGQHAVASSVGVHWTAAALNAADKEDRQLVPRDDRQPAGPVRATGG